MANKPSDLEDAHNKGQTDGSSGGSRDYDPPHKRSMIWDVVEEFTTPQEKLDDRRELNEAYDAGWTNSRKNRR